MTRVIENTGESVQWVVAVCSGSALLYLRTVYRECSNDRGHRVAAKNQTYTQADFWLLSVAKSSRNELAKLCGLWPVVHFFQLSPRIAPWSDTTHCWKRGTEVARGCICKQFPARFAFPSQINHFKVAQTDLWACKKESQMEDKWCISKQLSRLWTVCEHNTAI